MIKSPENYVLVEIEKKFQDENGGILIDPTWHPEEFTTLEGTVASAPASYKSDLVRKILGTVAEGDKIIFSYSVVFEYDLQPEDETPIYKNLLIYEGREYWKVHAGEIFFKITDSGLEMITDNILIEPTPTSDTEDYGGFTVTATSEKNTGIVAGMPNVNISCKKGDRVFFEPQFVQEYSFFNKPYYIIPARRLIAKEWI